MSVKDAQYMLRALKLADKGKYSVSPNPRVGAVIVHNNQIIGEGYHQEFGKAHAEVNAVNSVVDKTQLKDSTIYINLEPCSHFGKTPPCVDLLIKHQFKRVVIANSDPFEKVNGSGIEKLRNNNIAITLGLNQDKGLSLNKRFFTFHQKKRPYIILKWAQTKDGFISRKKEEITKTNNWISNSVSKQLVHLWRAEEDAILIGKNTALIDNPQLNCREVEGKNPARLVIDEQLELPTNLNVFKGPTKTFILNVSTNKTEKHLTYFQGEIRTKLIETVIRLCIANNLQSIIVEGGSNTLQQFIDKGVWDEARVFIGDIQFKDGIAAPTIDQKPVSVDQIKTDKLHIYKNSAV